MIRTNAFDVDINILNDEVEDLYEIYKGIINRAKYSRNLFYYLVMLEL